jgi:sigma-B regulation protein RsbU (phosphoserine phosphatase)
MELRILGRETLTMQVSAESTFRDQLMDRRRKLENAARSERTSADVARLLVEVDAALARMDEGTYGLCEVCHDPVEIDRLIADPLVRFCIDHLTPREQRALEDDLALAARIQRELLPKADTRVDGWEISYMYHPARVVSGDYCDLINSSDGAFFFMVGDVSGKGVAASMLMAHLHGLYRSLILTGLSLASLMERASRVFCESTLPTHYATLVGGRAEPSGEIEICNAGHPPPLVVTRDGVSDIQATGLPVGLFCEERFSTVRVRLAPEDALLLYTDGVSEARDEAGVEYGRERLRQLLASCHRRPAADVLKTCLDDLRKFRGRTAATDDLTLMVVRRALAA